jgi:predicted alpha/beta hydrolase family esterase
LIRQKWAQIGGRAELQAPEPTQAGLVSIPGDMAPVVIMPGLGGSGPEHWQTRWQQLMPESRRVVVRDWEHPRREEWVLALEAVVKDCPAPPVIVAHSLGCLVLAVLAERNPNLHGALLVAPPEPEGPQFPSVAECFRSFPRLPLGFPSIVVASQNDPYGSFGFAERCAHAWGSELCDVGERGHINADSRLGDWQEGQRLLRRLLG